MGFNIMPRKATTAKHPHRPTNIVRIGHSASKSGGLTTVYVAPEIARQWLKADDRRAVWYVGDGDNDGWLLIKPISADSAEGVKILRPRGGGKSAQISTGQYHPTGGKQNRFVTMNETEFKVTPDGLLVKVTPAFLDENYTPPQSNGANNNGVEANPALSGLSGVAARLNI